MKKLFTFAAAVLASFSLWAAEPDFESYNWGADDFATVFADHDGIVISSDASAWKGNFSGIQYVALGGGTDMSAASPTPYFGVTAAAGIDSVEIYWAPNGGDASNLAWIAWDDANNFKQQEVDYKGEGPEYTGSKSIEGATWQMFDFSATDETAILFGRQLKKVMYEGSQYQFGKNKTVNILGVRVWLHESKQVVSTEESLTAVTINDVAISATDLASLVSNTYLFLTDAYVTAPVVKFTKHTVITYDDESTKEKDEVIEVTSQPETTTWSASATINGNSYYVYTSKAASRTVTYMYGEQVLGTETVAVNGNPAEYAQYETMPLATFGGWYKDADLTQAVANIAAEVISVNATYYAKFTKAFLSESVNIEQLVLDNGTSYDIRSALTAAGWAYKDLNDLDTLNDIENKTNRNEAFLGLKLKTAGAYAQCWLQEGSRLDVKFGNIGCNVTLNLHGEMGDINVTYTKDDLASTNNIVSIFGQPEDKLVTFTTTGSSTVVLKQLILNSSIAEVTLPAPGAYLVTCAEAEHGTVEATWPNKKYRTPVGETVTLNVTPDEGYQVASITVDGEPLADVEGVYSFVMPAKEVTVAATFEVDPTTGINNTEATVKAVKVVRNGQLFIEKNGVVYNAQGAIVK